MWPNWSVEEQSKLWELTIDPNRISREELTTLVEHFRKARSLRKVYEGGDAIHASQNFARKVRNATRSGLLDWLLTENNDQEAGRGAGKRSESDSTESEIAAMERSVRPIRIEPDIGSQSGESPEGIEHIADMTWICEQLRAQVNMPVLQLFRSQEIDQASGRYWSAKGWTPDPESTFDVNWGVSIDRSYDSPFISLVV